MLRTHITKWQILVAGVGLVVVIALLGTVTFSVATTVVPDLGGTYVEAMVGRPRWINPVLSQQNEVDDSIAALVFNGLTKIGPTGEIEPDLAKSWEVDDGGKTYTFTLREGLEWHDGQAVTADDVIYTVRTLQDPSYQGPAVYADLWRGIGVEKVSNSQVRFELKEAYSPFLEFTTQGILPAHVLGSVAPRALPENAFNAKPIGTGPFRVVKASLGEVDLEAADTYYGPKPFLEQIRFRFYDDYDAAAAALRQDQVQSLSRVPSSTVSELMRDQRLTMHFAPELSKMTLLLFNVQDPIFSDVAVRKAVAYGIDVKRVIDTVLDGQGEQSYGPIIPQSWAYKQNVKRYDYNPVEARSLLGIAGWKAATPDGMREKDGQPLQFVLLTNDNPQRLAAAQEIARELAAVGIRVDVQATGWAGFVRDFLVPRKFQAALTELSSPNADPDCYQFWHSSQIKNGLNFAGWSNRRADDLLEKGRQTTSATERSRVYDEFQSVFADELPAVPLYYPTYSLALSKEVKGVDFQLLIKPADRFKGISDWYVRTKRVIGNIEIPVRQQNDSQKKQQ